MTDAEARGYLTSLPGIGPKTAAVVLSFALGRDAIPVDTHVHRVAGRLGWFPRRRAPSAPIGCCTIWSPTDSGPHCTWG
jgi:Predicted EndoIII-related endonuclease